MYVRGLLKRAGEVLNFPWESIYLSNNVHLVSFKVIPYASGPFASSLRRDNL